MAGSADYYRVSEAAALLKVSHSTVWRWIKSGKLPAQRVGPKTIRITREALTTFLEPEPATQADALEAEALRHYLAAIVESSHDAIIGKTLDGIITSWNPAAERMYGYTAAEAVGQPITLICPSNQVDEIPKILERLKRGERIEHYETVRRRKDGRLLHVSLTISPIRDRSGRIIGASKIARDITERQQTEEAERFLAQASAILASTLDYQTTIDQIARLAVPTLTDWCTLDILEQGHSRCMAVAHVDPAKEALLWDLRRRYPIFPDGPSPGSQVLRMGKSVLYPWFQSGELSRTTQDAEHLRLITALAPVSAMAVPLTVHGKTIGVMTLTSIRPERRLAQRDVRLAEELAGRAAIAIDNARLYRAERKVRAAAVQATERTARLQALTAALSAAVTPTDVADAIITEGVAALDASAGSVTLLTEDRAALEVVKAIGYPPTVLDPRRRIPIEAPLPLSEAVRTGAPVLLGSREAYSRYPAFTDLPAWRDNRATVALPLIVEKRAIGALGISFPGPREFSEHDRAFMETLAQQCSQALERARLYEAELESRSAAETAQRRLEFLAEASRILATSLDYETTLTAVTDLAVPRLADWCAIDLISDEGSVRRLAVSHLEPAKVVWAQELRKQYPFDPDAPTGLARVIRTGEPEFVPEITEAMVEAATSDPEVRDIILHKIGFSSMMIVPLVARGRRLGAITFVAAESKRRYDQADLAFAQDLAGRAALAVENARLYQEARQAIQLREEFLSIASHELKTPLTTVKTYTQLLARRLLKPEMDRDRLHGYTNNLQRQLDRLETLVADLLDASRIQQGRLELRLEQVDLVDLAQQVLARFEQAAERNERHRLVLEAPSPVAGLWDQVRLDQVLTNLISNALKYSPEGGEVRVAIRQVNAQAMIAVRDPGIGISSEEQAKLFQPFVRGDTVRGSVSGTGLGLYISRQIVEQHGGTISVDSELGRGTTFYVTLPWRAME
jgi:PAS domain S-box-containing protein/excisionase family DNA binding protein